MPVIYPAVSGGYMVKQKQTKSARKAEKEENIKEIASERKQEELKVKTGAEGKPEELTVKVTAEEKPEEFTAKVTAEEFKIKVTAEEKQEELMVKITLEEKIEELIGKMTMEEKIDQLCEQWGFPGVERLGIPPLYKGECVHGYSYGTGAAVFPQAIALGSTWDVDLAEKAGRVTGEESAAANVHMAWSPVLDIARDMRWGRVEETYGEDTCLVTKIGMAWIKGYQGEGLSAAPKHFAAHGASLGGRDSHYAGYSERVLREVYLPPFREAVKKLKVQSIMSAYHFLDGTGCSASKELLTKILREEWGFEGFVVTDVGAPDNIIEKQYNARNEKEAAALMLKAGVDSCAPGAVYRQGLPRALQEGLVTENEINGRVADLLRVKFRLGLFEREENPPMIWSDANGWDSAGHRAAAYEAAKKSIVLLKNENRILPLSKKHKKIALIGPAIKSQELGDYSCEPEEGQIITIYEGVKRLLGREDVINYARGCSFTGEDTSGISEAVKAAEQSEAVILAVGDQSNTTTGESRDRADISLTGVQNDLIRAVAATKKPVVLVLACGKPAAIEWAAEHIPGILMTWYSGEEGGNAIAEVLFGDYNPGGKLPVTWPRSGMQLPLFYNYHLSGRGYDYIDVPFAPRYRFGHGLSYTGFSYGKLAVLPEGNGKLTVQAEVTNTGDRDGEEVVQLYVTHMYPSVSTPVTELKDFLRIPLMEGESRTVTFHLEPYDLSLLDKNLERKVEAGEYKVMVGGISPDCPHTTKLKSNIGYSSAAEGVTGTFLIEKELKPEFEFLADVEENGCGISVKNTGFITDTGRIEVFIDGRKYGEKHFEADPGEEKTVRLLYRLTSGNHRITVICKNRIIAETEVRKS